jgi:tRNA(Ile)-lysidine synthase
MLTHFDKVFRIDLRLKKDEQILVGVSGGPDSLCLLDLLHKNGYSVIVAHLNHGLRPESGDEAHRVEEVAVSYGFPFVLEECNILALSEATGKSLEHMAREARYGFLFRQASVADAQAVLVGHNADDQVETVLMHFLQGAGMTGLMGMKKITLPNPWSEVIPLIRPLLMTWRSQILDYCRDNNLDPIFDSSNQDTEYFRNRIRHELIPYLESYVPGVRVRLLQMADVFETDYKFLHEYIDRAREDCLEICGDGYVPFDAICFNKQPLSLRRHLVRWAISTLREDVRELDYDAIERALSVAKSVSQSGQQDLVMGIRAYLEDGVFYLASWEADLPQVQWPQISHEVIIEAPGHVELSNGWYLIVKPIVNGESVQEQVSTNPDPYRAWVDVGDQLTSLKVRGRRAGDMFVPLGMGGKSKKLSDFMIDQKIPKRARECWPLVCLGDEIIWVPGVRQSHEFKLGPKTEQVIYLQLIPPS